MPSSTIWSFIVDGGTLHGRWMYWSILIPLKQNRGTNITTNVIKIICSVDVLNFGAPSTAIGFFWLLSKKPKIEDVVKVLSICICI
ncbi:unnamed protein product [Lactuca virosa]|uniref:Uncharacterized protein n=1 Tax=Lactuca virosa TaxID=75947 RepID=A0AAU9NRH1_9ASTR|nr:unnamed protein product [Lactuca virosa]